jgi:hypothetical protein
MAPKSPTHNYCTVAFIPTGIHPAPPVLIAVFPRVQIECRLNLCVTQEPCTVLGSIFALFTRAFFATVSLHTSALHIYSFCTAIAEQKNLQA